MLSTVQPLWRAIRCGRTVVCRLIHQQRRKVAPKHAEQLQQKQTAKKDEEAAQKSSAHANFVRAA